MNEAQRKIGIGSSRSSSILVDISLNFPGMNKCIVGLPFQKTQAHDVLEDVLTQGIAYDAIGLQIIQGLLEVGGQSFDAHSLALGWTQVVDIEVHRLSRIDAPFYAVETCCQNDCEDQIRIACRVWRAEFYPG